MDSSEYEGWFQAAAIGSGNRGPCEDASEVGLPQGFPGGRGQKLDVAGMERSNHLCSLLLEACTRVINTPDRVTSGEDFSEGCLKVFCLLESVVDLRQKNCGSLPDHLPPRMNLTKNAICSSLTLPG